MTMAIDLPAGATTTTAAGPCAACGADAWRPHLRQLVDHLTGEPFDIDRCTACGLMSTRPPPPPGQIGRYYPPRYRGNRHAFTGRWRDGRRGRAVEACFPAHFRGRLLDVGCGNGTFARHMHGRGWAVGATEIDGPTVDQLRAEGIDARRPADAEAGGFAGGPFDAVTCWHVLEHVADPAALARWAVTQLRPGGVFQATVPNVASAQARLFGRRWMHLDVPRHLHHFTPATFRSLLTTAGFAVERQTTFALEYDWFGVIQSALDMACRRPNVLFDKLTDAPDAVRASAADVALTVALAGPVAAASLPPLLLGWAVGDGATLTLTCRRR
jgi:SAM-dependent methyltransferase